MTSLSEKEKQWKDVWTLYDSDKDGKITKDEFISAVRVLGHRYTQAQMEEKTRNIGKIVDWESYFGFLCDPYTGPTKDDLINALRAFDGKDSGELTVAQITSMLTTMGDKMSAEEAGIVVKNLPAVHGKVKIDDLIAYLTPAVPSTNPNIEEILREVMREELRNAQADEQLMEKPPTPPPQDHHQQHQGGHAAGSNNGSKSANGDAPPSHHSPAESLNESQGADLRRQLERAVDPQSDDD